MNFSLLYPAKPLHVNQIFGNPDPKYFALGLKGHNGIDFMATHGQPVYAAHDGYVTGDVTIADTYGGHGVTLRTSQYYTYTNGQECVYTSIYWHFLPYLVVKVGDNIKAGDLIGFADNTGFSTGDHLHFGLKPISMSGQNIEQENGYLGAIDPNPYFNGQYAQDVPRSAAERLRVLGLQYIALGIIKQGNIILAISKLFNSFV